MNAEVVLSEADVAAVAECLHEGWLTMGPRTQAFEEELAAWTGSPHAVALASGTAALLLALRTAGVGPGDEVVVPALAPPAVALTPGALGARAVLADVRGPGDPVAGVAEVERHVTARTRAVVAVHPWGVLAPAGALRAWCDERGLTLVEDASPAAGRPLRDAPGRAGTAGHAGCLSLAAGQPLCAGGEGGALLTADPEVADRARLLRSHALTSTTWDRHRGHAHGYDVVAIGDNLRLDEPRAALGRSRLARADAELAARRAGLDAARAALAAVPGTAALDTGHGALVVLLADATARDAAARALARAGVAAEPVRALHALAAFRALAAPGALPGAEAAAERLLVLGPAPPERLAAALAR